MSFNLFDLFTQFRDAYRAEHGSDYVGTLREFIFFVALHVCNIHNEWHALDEAREFAAECGHDLPPDLRQFTSADYPEFYSLTPEQQTYLVRLDHALLRELAV